MTWRWTPSATVACEVEDATCLQRGVTIASELCSSKSWRSKWNFECLILMWNINNWKSKRSQWVLLKAMFDQEILQIHGSPDFEMPTAKGITSQYCIADKWSWAKKAEGKGGSSGNIQQFYHQCSQVELLASWLVAPAPLRLRSWYRSGRRKRLVPWPRI